MLAIFVVLTVRAARDGVWLMFLLVAPAVSRSRAAADSTAPAVASALGTGSSPSERRSHSCCSPPHPRVPPRDGVSRAIVATAVRLAAGRPILADAMPAEQVALAGGRIWAGNPLDAFSQATQAAYLDFIGAGTGPQVRALLADNRIAVILATVGGPAAHAAAADPAFARAAADPTAVVYVRRPRP